MSAQLTYRPGACGAALLFLTPSDPALLTRHQGGQVYRERQCVLHFPGSGDLVAQGDGR
jgi:hypothetical protein